MFYGEAAAECKSMRYGGGAATGGGEPQQGSYIFNGTAEACWQTMFYGRSTEK
jgi:hypothetical protein